MAAIRYDGKVVIVTGAGAGLGRIYAKMFAERGAKVVVNDLGKNKETGARAADAVVAEIKAMGGDAVANYDSVVDGQKLVDTAISAFGAVHILVNNAGILRDVSFHRMTDAQFDIIMKVHVYGTYALCRAAWPHFRNQKYGRIVNVTSVNGLYGQFGQANYSAAKSAILGFTKTLAQEGAKKNIKVNVLAPGAGTAMTATVMPENLVAAWKPEFVAPLVGYLASEEVPCSGSIFESGGGWTAQVKWVRTQGAYFDIEKPISPELVRQQWAKITDFEGCVFPDDTKAEEQSNPFENPQLKQILAKL